MERYFTGRYDKQLAGAFYNLYLENKDPGDLNEFIKLVMPLIRRVSTVYATGCRSHIKYLEAEALNNVYDAVVNQLLPTDPIELFRYLYVVIKNSVMRAITKWVYPQVVNLAEACVEYPSGSVRSHEQVERKILRQQIDKQVKSIASSNVKFTGAERSACIDIITRMVYGSDYNKDALRHKYNLTTDKFNTLTAHARVLVKRGYYQVGEDEGAV